MSSIDKIQRIMTIFKTSDGGIRPHFILTGPSGSGKSHTIATLADELDLPVIDVNAAALTKEGTSGNSVSKALTPLIQHGNSPVICFVDEFDKLFISGNVNSHLAHETTNGVQNEFLKALEGSTSVFGDYGKYHTVNTDKVLFVFAGAFNGEDDIDVDRLRELGIKTEFLGRVGLIYNLQKPTISEMQSILENSKLLDNYLTLVPSADKSDVTNKVMEVVHDVYDNNTLGIRILNTLLHQYFIEGNLGKRETKKISFQKTLELPA